jgi:hypothetical protein
MVIHGYWYVALASEKLTSIVTVSPKPEEVAIIAKGNE